MLFCLFFMLFYLFYFLNEYLIDLTVRDTETGKSLLHFACESQDWRFIETLIIHGAKSSGTFYGSGGVGGGGGAA